MPVRAEAEAKQRIEAGDFAAALTILEQVPAALTTDAIRQLIGEARASEATAQKLAGEIRLAVAENRLEGLSPQVAAPLNLKPHDAAMLKLQLELQTWESNQTKKRCERLHKLALSELQKYRYENAVRLLEQIDESMAHRNSINCCAKRNCELTKSIGCEPICAKPSLMTNTCCPLPNGL